MSTSDLNLNDVVSLTIGYISDFQKPIISRSLYHFFNQTGESKEMAVSRARRRPKSL